MKRKPVVAHCGCAWEYFLLQLWNACRSIWMHRLIRVRTDDEPLKCQRISSPLADSEKVEILWGFRSNTYFFEAAKG